VTREISRVGVVGLGTMGAGIAQVCVQGGVEVVGREVSAELGERAAERIGHFLTRAVEKGRIEQADRDAAVGRLRLTTDLGDLAGCDLVIEAATESQDVKESIFRRLDEITALGFPVVIGTSRKSFLGRLTGRDVPAERVAGTIATNVLALERGARVFRVHDVAPTVEALTVAAATVPAR